LGQGSRKSITIVNIFGKILYSNYHATAFGHGYGNLVERVLSEAGEPIDYSPELEQLREFWRVFEGGEAQPVQ
jgi:hypothetical protein